MELEELVSGKKKEPREHRSYRKVLGATLLIVLVATSFVALFTFYSAITQTKALPDGLNKLAVTILPRECKLYPGETQDFEAVVANGVAPLTFRWEANGTGLGDTQTVTFGFSVPCDYIVLSVMVWDSQMWFGIDSILVYDPAFESRAKYMEAVMPYSYIVESNGTHSAYYNGTTCKREMLSTTALTVLQTAVNNSPENGSVIFIKSPFETAQNAELVINKTCITIKTDVIGYGAVVGWGIGRGVYISKILLHGTTASPVKGITLQGIHFNQLRFYDNQTNAGMKISMLTIVW